MANVALPLYGWSVYINYLHFCFKTERDLSFPPYLIISLYQYGLIYFIFLFLIIPLSLFFCYFVFEHFLKIFLTLQDALGSSCIFSASVIDSAISLKSPGSFDWRMVLETKIRYEVCASRFCQLREQGDICLYTIPVWMYIHVSINISVCKHLYFKLNVSSYTVSMTLIHYYLHHPCFFPLLVCNSPLT